MRAGGTFQSRRLRMKRRCAPRVKPMSARTRPSGSIWRRPVSDLIVSPSATPAADGSILRVTPESAGWKYVGFEVLNLAARDVAARDTGDLEVCVVVVAGTVNIV